MRRSYFPAAICLLWTAAAWPQSVKAVLGSWEGDSKCTVADSPCHDEHVLYQIAEDKKDPWQLNLDGYKIVDGAPEFMGTLACHYQSKVGALSCTSSSKEKDDWEFHLNGGYDVGPIDGGRWQDSVPPHRSPQVGAEVEVRMPCRC